MTEARGAERVHRARQQGGLRDRGRTRELLCEAEAGYAEFGLDHQVERARRALAG